MDLTAIDQENWRSYAPYVDTILLPIYTMAIVDKEFRFANSKMIEQVVYQIEKRITGRLLLLPAVWDTGCNPPIFYQYLKHLLNSFEHAGFHYLITIAETEIPMMENEETKHFHFQLNQHQLHEDQIEKTVEDCVHQILQLWVKSV